MSHMTVFNGRERRRRWSDEDRSRILAEAFSSACVAAVARRNDISTSLIYQWRDKQSSGEFPPTGATTGADHDAVRVASAAQRFLSTHDPIANLSPGRPSQNTAVQFHSSRRQAFATWTEITGAAMAA
jgi:transposase-like protein